MPKTQQEIDALKENWKQDPCWDIETTEGFEEHKDELLAFRLEWEDKWKAEDDEERKKTFEYRASIIRHNMYADAGTESAAENTAMSQVEATLLLAEQVAKLVHINALMAPILNNRPA